MPATTFVGLKFHNVWDQLLDRLLEYPEYTAAPRGKQVRELGSVLLCVEDAYENVLVNSARDLNYRIMVSEWLWISLGRSELAPLLRYNKRMAEFSDNGISLYGAYGPRLGAQLTGAIAKLQQDQDSRQACAVIWNHEDVFSKSRDIPCTMTFQWLVRNGRLNTIVTMRSSDIWLGLPYDFFTFTQLSNGMAGELGLPLGWMCMHLGSSHLYEENVEVAREAQKEWESYTLRSNPLPSRVPTEMAQALDTAQVDSRLQPPWYGYAVVLSQPTKHDSLSAMKAVCDLRSTNIT